MQFHELKRREFITLLGGAAAGMAVCGPARSSRRSCRPSDFWVQPRFQPWANGLPLSCSGCANSAGSKVAILRSSIGGQKARSERYGEIAAELVQSKVDVIVTTAPAFPAVQRATSVIPIVCTITSRPSSRWLRRELGTTRKERNRA